MLFLSTFQNKIDKKGRISVPAQFRSALTKAENSEFNGIISYASFINPCIESCGFERIKQLAQRIESLDPFSEEHDAFSTIILGGSVQLPFDSEGRILLPEDLLEIASIKEAAVFVGKGATFEIWEPKSFAAYSARSRDIAREKRLHLKSGGAL